MHTQFGSSAYSCPHWRETLHLRFPKVPNEFASLFSSLVPLLSFIPRHAARRLPISHLSVSPTPLSLLLLVRAFTKVAKSVLLRRPTCLVTSDGRSHKHTDLLAQATDCTYDPLPYSHAFLPVTVFRHTGEKPFACAQCPKRYKDRTGLRQHVRRKHPGAFSSGHSDASDGIQPG